MGHIRVEKIGDRIWLKGSYSDTYPKCKDIKGASFRGSEKVWTYPLDLVTCRELRGMFGDKLVIGPELSAWAWSARQHEDTMAELGRSMDSELQHVPEISPVLAQAMASRTYQRSGAKFVATGRRVLLADEPSLGKTATALAGIIESEAWVGDHLVVAPKTSLSSTWGRQIRLWTPDAEVFVMPEGKVKRREMLDGFLASAAQTKFLIVNPAMMRMLLDEWCDQCQAWVVKDKKKNSPEHYYFRHKAKQVVKKCDWPELIGHRWTSCIIDECHEHFAQYRPSNVTQTMEGLARIQPDIRIALTGTPVRGHEKKLWGTLKWLGAIQSNQLHTGYWRWIETWLEVDKSGFGWDIGGLKEDREEEFKKHISAYIRRLTKKEARPDLPEKQYIPVWVPLEGKHKAQYEKFLSEGEAGLKDGSIKSKGVLDELTRLRQFAFGVWDGDSDHIYPTPDSPKIEWVVQALQERGVTGNPKTDFLPEDENSGYKYVVASQFTMVVDAVERALSALGIETLKLTGDIIGQKRDDIVKMFNSDDTKHRVLLLNSKTGGVSIDLDTHCDEMFIMDETWISDDQVQLEGRIDNRSGRVAVRTFYNIRTENTVEETLAETNLSQDELSKELLDRSRGVELAKKIIENTRKVQKSSVN